MTDRTPRKYIAVIGPAEASTELCALAEEVGRLLGETGAVLVTGGLGGVMAAACRGAHNAGGDTVGLLPGSDRAAANEWVDVAIPTGLAELRNALVVGSADAVIAVGGSWGTLSEVAFACRSGRRIVGLATWSVLTDDGEPAPDGPHAATGPADAVRQALA